MTVDPTMVTLQSEKYPEAQGVAVLSCPSCPAVQVTSDPQFLSACKSLLVYEKYSARVSKDELFTADFPNSPVMTHCNGMNYSAVRINRAAAVLAESSSVG